MQEVYLKCSGGSIKKEHEEGTAGTPRGENYCRLISWTGKEKDKKSNMIYCIESIEAQSNQF
jgi:hypothetical protein